MIDEDEAVNLEKESTEINDLQIITPNNYDLESDVIDDEKLLD